MGFRHPGASLFSKLKSGFLIEGGEGPDGYRDKPAFFYINIEPRHRCSLHNQYRDWVLKQEEEFKEQERIQQEEKEKQQREAQEQIKQQRESDKIMQLQHRK